MGSRARAADRFRLVASGVGVVAAGRTILSDVSLDVARGEVVAILGPNGSGKTTLIEAIAGLRPDATGSVALGGRALATFRDRASAMSFMPDEAVLPEETTLATALALGAGAPLVERFDLGALLGARAREISRGESKRAQLCAALALGRPVVLLDEPFVALDPLQLRSLLPMFRDAARDAAVVVTIHQMSTAELVADRLLLLAGGRAIAFGTLDELRERASAPGAHLDEVFLRLLDRSGATHAAS